MTRRIDPSLRAGFKLPVEYRMDVSTASDPQIFDEVVRLLEAYLVGLGFSRAYDGHYDGSPYDVFLRMNNLPAGPSTGGHSLNEF